MNKLLLAGILVLTGTAAQATPVHFKNCKSDIVTEIFTSCPDGEGGSSTICGSQQTKWGSVVSDLTVDSQQKTATATLVYTEVSGQVKTSPVTCAMGTDNWMECTSVEAISQLGKLMITFNIDGIAPNVYFADIFADATNVPVGGFQNTSMACEMAP